MLVIMKIINFVTQNIKQVFMIRLLQDTSEKMTVFFTSKNSDHILHLPQEQQKYTQTKIDNKEHIIPLLQEEGMTYLILINEDLKSLEDYRCLGSKLFKAVEVEKMSQVNIHGACAQVPALLAFAEGFALESYQFLKYFKEETKKEKAHSIEQLGIYHPEIQAEEVDRLKHIIKAVFWARDLVNEPVNHLNAIQFAEEVSNKGKEAGFQVDIMNKAKITSLNMGGLLAVNKGSQDPPTFTICEWKPANAVNTKPYVLVGKGVMYDTGGLSLKPTSNCMDLMKSDMGGAATVAATLYALALNDSPVWVIALLPATDNRPGGNACTPGDIINMYNGLSVEVLNTDAEGRLILADALSFGDQYDPELICTVATLTGSAEMAIGSKASVFMGNASEETFTQLQAAATHTHERLVQFPFWKEYGESLKSDVADLKNLGERAGGAISAGKFLEHFTQKPFIHFDIAGTAFLSSPEAYKPKGGTGVGIRLLTTFFDDMARQ